MRYALPPTPASSPGSAQMILDTNGCYVQVILQNVGAIPIWVSRNREALDGSLDSSLTPQVGFVLSPNTPPVTIDRYNGQLYARAQVPGGLVECEKG
jgi:hypothetical protein